ncbi:MAG: phosphate regulon sensor histidine kinase PhoR [Xanthomonadales bacterium]|nr:phosphate regulon sensor histidine kinase PhoR [Xanthomonadales bacterium]
MASRHWTFHAGTLALCAGLVLLLGWIVGHPVIVTAIFAGAYLAWHAVNLRRLHAWLQNHQAEIPESHGVWADIYDGLNTMDKQNRRQREEYRAMIGEFRALTDAFPDATLVIDENDDITWFNNAAQTLLELRIPEDLGQNVTNLLRGPDFADWLAVQGQVKSPLEMPSPLSDNTWLNISAIAFRENLRLIILRDVTEVHNVERIRRDFVANISHELRTPLTVLQGYLEILQQNPSGGVADAVSRMQVQAIQMKSLLDDLLELSRLQRAENRGEDSCIDVCAMLMQLKEQAEELSGGHHRLHFELDRELFLSGVGSDLESAFSNLITNAVKYTPDDGRIEVSWQDSEKGPVLRVRDTGIGIPRRDIPRLTERFYRVGSDRARQTGGSGLGLAIVKHVLNAHQAQLNIHSELGEGSEFVCTFPPERKRKRGAPRK